MAHFDLIDTEKPQKTKETKEHNVIELAKEKPTSVISLNRNFTLDVDFADPKTLQELYISVPEVSRAIDLRGSTIIYRGYEIEARDDSKEAEDFANLCSYIVDQSGGVNFFEQWQKNGDLFGDGYVEIVEIDGRVDELAHVSPQLFGYELDTKYNEELFAFVSTVKLDPATQKPVGYATYKFDEEKQVFVNDKQVPLESIAHLKYKLVADAVYGVSLIQPMYGSVIRKLKMEDSIDVAGRLVAAPKIVIEGEFDDDIDAKEEAREAASLDVNDVIVLQNGNKFQFVTPGKISLPDLREIFVVNITTASGIPRPVLTSESAEINKATMQELMQQLRENMRSNVNKMVNVCEREIFARIGQVYGIKDYFRIIPKLSFPEDVETEEAIIKREEKKAATLTSLSNSLVMLNNIIESGATSSLDTRLTELMNQTIDTYEATLENFTINNDQDLAKKEEVIPEDIKDDTFVQLGHFDVPEEPNDVGVADNVEVIETQTEVTITDEDDFRLNRPEYIEERHHLVHMLYEQVITGAEIFDIVSGKLITIPSIIKKHDFYIRMMEKLGMVHDLVEIGAELDETI